MLILLSLNSLISRTISSFSLLINCQIYTISFAIYPSTMYSALVIKVDNVFYFLLLYEITALLKKKQYLMTDF